MGNKTELILEKQHNIIVLSKNVKQPSQSKLARLAFSVAFFEI
jgi:hypothetical protein